jgi:hypothetical protein
MCHCADPAVVQDLADALQVDKQQAASILEDLYIPKRPSCEDFHYATVTLMNSPTCCSPRQVTQSFTCVHLTEYRCQAVR